VFTFAPIKRLLLNTVIGTLKPFIATCPLSFVIPIEPYSFPFAVPPSVVTSTQPNFIISLSP